MQIMNILPYRESRQYYNYEKLLLIYSFNTQLQQYPYKHTLNCPVTQNYICQIVIGNVNFTLINQSEEKKYRSIDIYWLQNGIFSNTRSTEKYAEIK